MNWIDYPNLRSGHNSPVISGGGIAVYAVFLMVAVYLSIFADIEFFDNELLPLVTILVMVGFLDDISGLRITSRLLIYTTVSFITILTLFFNYNYPTAAYFHFFLVSICFCLFINLYNFMDGIDGLLATHCIISLAIAVFLLTIQSAPKNLVLFCGVLASVQVGFLILNWSPATLFMGDAGSIPTGFLMGVIAIETSTRAFLPIAAWAIILSPFLTDSIGTLIFRLFRLENIFKPHSSHMYQKLARYWNSHRRVVIIMAMFQCFWCAPLAYFVTMCPDYAIHLLLLTYAPLLLGLLKSRNLA